MPFICQSFMHPTFEDVKSPLKDRHLIRLKQRGEALRFIATTGKCPGVVPWPLNQQIPGFGPDPCLCSQCDLYLGCPILDELQAKISPASAKLSGNVP